MFELRWLCSKRNNWERALQYRTSIEWSHGQAQWSEWRDVPDVIEGTEVEREARDQAGVSGERNGRPNDDAGVLP